MTSKILNAVDNAGQWLAYDGVEGVGQGIEDDQDCIVVFVSRPAHEFAVKIPKVLKGFRVVIQETGAIEVE